MVERINDNTYKFDLKGKSNASATFNVVDLVPFDFDVGFDSRMNLIKERGNDENQSQHRGSKDPLQGIKCLMSINQVKYANVALLKLIRNLLAKESIHFEDVKVEESSLRLVNVFLASFQGFK